MCASEPELDKYLHIFKDYFGLGIATHPPVSARRHPYKTSLPLSINMESQHPPLAEDVRHWVGKRCVAIGYHNLLR